MISTYEFIARLGLAVAMGFAIGLERQLAGHVPGIRVNVLVSIGTSMFVMFSFLVSTPDLTRIAAQIVTGVGFLCSGIIFKDGVNVRGLNTAATIWCTAAVGVLSSSGQYWLAIAGTAIVLASNIGFRELCRHITPLKGHDDWGEDNYYEFSITCDEMDKKRLREMMLNRIAESIFVLKTLSSSDLSRGRSEIRATVMYPGGRRDDMAERMVGTFSTLPGVTDVSWEFI